MELIVEKQRIVRFEKDIGTVLILRVLGHIALLVAALKDQRAHLALSVGAHLEACAQRIDRLDAHTVESHALLESLGVVFAARIEHAHGLDELALRDAAAIVAHADTQIVVDIHLDAVALFHLKLVDRVVYHLFQQHIDAVFGQRSVAQTTDIHTRTGTHVLHIRQVADIVLGILHRRLQSILVFQLVFHHPSIFFL